MTCVLKCVLFVIILFINNLCFIIRFENTHRYNGNAILRFCNSIAVGKRELYTRSVHDVLTGVYYKLTRCIRFVVAAALFGERRLLGLRTRFVRKRKRLTAHIRLGRGGLGKRTEQSNYFRGTRLLG